MKRFAIVLILMATPGLADIQRPGGKVIECYCTDSQGARVELGQMICLNINGREFMAQCQMSLNNPMWREVETGCPAQSLPTG
ncbi:MAG: hypothetical protein AAFX00_13595 [Pseudomonadota bacterium]